MTAHASRTRRTRGMSATAAAFASVTLMLMIVRNAGVEGAVPTGLLLSAFAAVTAVLLTCAAVRVMGGRMPRETEARLLMETTGMLAVATPVVLVVAIAAGWVA